MFGRVDEEVRRASKPWFLTVKERKPTGRCAEIPPDRASFSPGYADQSDPARSIPDGDGS